MKIDKRKTKGDVTIRAIFSLAVIAVGLSSLPLILSAGSVPDSGQPANYPDWWFEQDVIAPKEGETSPYHWPEDYPSVIDHAAVNQGQLKWMARGARAHLEAVFSAAAGGHPAEVATITNSSQWNSLTNLIQGWDAGGAGETDYTVANQGQVKEVARHFYEVFELPEVAYHSDAVSGWDASETYPWSTENPQGLDYAAANQGQVKNLFAFDLSNWTPTTGGIDPLDTDGDGLPDSWEQAIVDADANDAITSITQVLASDDGSSPSLYWDFDGDGYDNLTEQLNETDPTDFYNGEIPVLVLQTTYTDDYLVSDGYLLPALEIKVTDGTGAAFQNGNVPVSFTVSGPGGVTTPSAGGGAPDGSVDPASSLNVTTTRNGSNEDIATVYFSSAAAGESTVTVSLNVPGATDLAVPIRAWADDHLVACWALDEDDNEIALDSSGFGQDAAIHGGPVLTASWDGSLAFQFDGTDDNLSLSGTADNGLDFVNDSFTVSFWVSTTATDARLLGTGLDNWEVGYSVGLNANGQVVAGVGGDVDTASMLIRTAAAVNDGAWHHVAVVFAGGGTADLARIYIDGQPQELAKADPNTGGTLTDVGTDLSSALDVSALSGMDASSEEPFTIGAYSDGTTPSAFFTGLLDDVRIYRTALSAAQVLALTDTDADNLPDLYELAFFPDDPDALTHLNGDDVADFDGDGLSDWAEYGHVSQQTPAVASDPTDYYSQGDTLIQPEIEIVSGDGQSVDAGTFTAVPLVAKVYEKDTDPPVALINAPVDLSVYISTGRVSATGDGSSPVARTMTLRTADLSGEAHVGAYFQASTGLSTTAQVRATTGKVAPVNVSYSVTVNGPPEPPRGIAVQEFATSAPEDTQFTITWSDNSDDETGFTIQYQLANGTWATLGTSGADTTSFSLSQSDASSLGFTNSTNTRVQADNAQGSSQSEESEPDKPAPRYAVIDLGPGQGRHINKHGAVALHDGDKSIYWENGEATEIPTENEQSFFPAGLSDDGIVFLNGYRVEMVDGFFINYAFYSNKGAKPVGLDRKIPYESEDNGDQETDIYITGGSTAYGNLYDSDGTWWVVEWKPYDGEVDAIWVDGPGLWYAEGVIATNNKGDAIYEHWDGSEIKFTLNGEIVDQDIFNDGAADLNDDRILVSDTRWWDGKWHYLPPGGYAYRITNRKRTDEEGSDIPDYQILGISGTYPNQSFNLWEKRNPKGEVSEGYHSYKLQEELLIDPETWQIKMARNINDDGLIVGQAEEYALDEEGKRTGSPIATKAVLLLPMDLDTRDRVVQGRIKLPEDWTGFSLQFRNTTSGQDLGTYENVVETLNGSGNSFYIYDDIDDIYSESEIEQIETGSVESEVMDQDVVFVKDRNDPKKLWFTAVFDDLGDIEIILKKDGQNFGTIGATLEEDEIVSELINHLDARISSRDIPIPVHGPIDFDGDGLPDEGGEDDMGLLVVQTPSTMDDPGVYLTEAEEGIPSNLLLPLNTDNDDAQPLPHEDNQDTSIGFDDDDIARLTLRRPEGLTTNEGTLTLTVSQAPAVRIFNSSGTAALAQYTVDLANPSGDLAGLANGNVSLFVEGLVVNGDVTFTLTYKNAFGVVQETDEVHMSVGGGTASIYRNLMETHLARSEWRYTTRHMPVRLQLQLVGLLFGQTAGEEEVENRTGVTKVLVITTVEYGFHFDRVDLLRGIPNWFGPLLQGVLDGAWDGAVDDVEFVTLVLQQVPGAASSIGELALDPYRAMIEAGTMSRNIMQFALELPNTDWSNVSSSLLGIIDNELDSMLVGAEKSATWVFSEADDNVSVVAYSTGYVFGYGLEQLFLMGAVSKKFGQILKQGWAISRGTAVAVGTVLKTSRLKIGLMRVAITSVKTRDEVRRIRTMIKEISRHQLPSGKYASEVIVDKLDDLAGDPKANFKTIVDELGKYTSGQWDTVGRMAGIRLAEVIEIMGSHTTMDSIQGFMRYYGSITRNLPNNGIGDYFDDLKRVLAATGGGAPDPADLAKVLEMFSDGPSKFFSAVAGNPKGWTTPGGLLYETAPPLSQGHRVSHIYSHTVPGFKSPPHGVFSKNRDELPGFIDIIYSKRNDAGVLNNFHNANRNNDVFRVPSTGAGTATGQDYVFLVLKKGTNKIVSSYPVNDTTIPN
ncbi:MAG: LamG domain-containing protein [Verrucomicrobiota bacterium]